jgi:kinesin family protein 2/24
MCSSICFICLLSIYSFQQVISEPFEPSAFIPGGTREFEDDFNSVSFKQGGGEAITDASHFLPVNEKENNTRENNVAKIKVVVC